MSAENGITTGLSEKASTVCWISCHGCKGEVGIPEDWNQNSVECPSCGERVIVSGQILYRPPSVKPVGPVVDSAQLAVTTPSLELQRKADLTLTWGVVSIVLGWTIIVPLIALCVYLETSDLAKKEQVPTPGKSMTGLILALLFGIVQGLAVISKAF